MPNLIKTTDELLSITAPPAMVIPFSKGNTSMTYNFNPFGTAIGQRGNITIAALGFGVLSPAYTVLTGLDEKTWEARQVFYNTDKTMFGSILTQDITNVSIYMDVTLSTSLTPPGTDYYPYVALAKTSSSSNNMFEIIPETVTSVTLVNGTTYANGSLHSATQTFIPVEFKKGTRIIVVCGFSTSDSSATSNDYSSQSLNFSGGVALY